MNVKDSDAFLSDIGSEVKRRRSELGLTQIELADEAGIHPNVIGRLERGNYNPSVLTLGAIAAALNTSLSEVLMPRKPVRTKRPKLTVA